MKDFIPVICMAVIAVALVIKPTENQIILAIVSAIGGHMIPRIK